MKLINLEKVRHRDEDRILVKFKYDSELIALIRTIDGCRWSATHHCWHVRDSVENLKLLSEIFEEKAWLDTTCLSGIKKKIENKTVKKPLLTGEMSVETHESIEKFRFWLKSRRYSIKTIDTYIDSLRIFFNFYYDKKNEEINYDDIIRFNNEYILANSYSASYQNQVVSAIKLYYKQVLKKAINIDEIERPKRPRKLPDILSKEEVEKLLKTPINLKHKMMLSLIYACGLRRSELLNLTVRSADYNRRLLIIKGAKGNKDRVAPLPIKIIDKLKDYCEQYEPVFWLFTGHNKRERYSETSIQEVFKISVEKAGINKKATLHWLRHSYATHLLENGTDLRYIQEILGHKSSETTEIYTHVTSKNIEKIKSPFDDLDV